MFFRLLRCSSPLSAPVFLAASLNAVNSSQLQTSADQQREQLANTPKKTRVVRLPPSLPPPKPAAARLQRDQAFWVRERIRWKAGPRQLRGAHSAAADGLRHSPRLTPQLAREKSAPSEGLKIKATHRLPSFALPPACTGVVATSVFVEPEVRTAAGGRPTHRLLILTCRSRKRCRIPLRWACCCARRSVCAFQKS